MIIYARKTLAKEYLGVIWISNDENIGSFCTLDGSYQRPKTPHETLHETKNLLRKF